MFAFFYTFYVTFWVFFYIFLPKIYESIVFMAQEKTLIECLSKVSIEHNSRNQGEGRSLVDKRTK